MYVLCVCLCVCVSITCCHTYVILLQCRHKRGHAWLFSSADLWYTLCTFFFYHCYCPFYVYFFFLYIIVLVVNGPSL